MKKTNHNKKKGLEFSALAISAGGKKTLSPNQQAFNKLTARIEKLRKEIDKKGEQFETAIRIYNNNIRPLQQQLALKRREVLNLLWPFFKKKQLPKADQAYLKSLIREHLQFVLQNSSEEPDEDLKLMFKELEGERYEAVLEREKKEMQDEMKSMFEKMDIDLDFSDTDEENMDEKLAEARQKLREQQIREEEKRQQQQKTRKKTAKQMEKENLQQAVDEMKQKNISTIYRQLAKLFHPDLERDETLRGEKEVLMKQLTSAYESKNLHELLLLEMKWIHKEQNHLEALTEEKLAVYLQILREQAQELESEKLHLYQKPQYMILAQEFGYEGTQQPLRTVQQQAANLNGEALSLEQDIQELQTANALKYVRLMVKEWKEVENESEMDDLLFQMVNEMRRGRW